MKRSKDFDRGDSRLVPVRIVAIYAIVSAAWILFSDTLLGMLLHDAQVVAELSMVKGIAFVCVTSGLLYPLIRGATQAIEHREDAMRRAKETAEAASRAKDRFIANLSHELRTPLTPVLAVLSAREGDASLPQRMREDLSLMRRNVLLQARMIDDLLDMTAIGQGKLRMEKRAIDANEVLEQAMQIVRADAGAKELELTLALEAGRHHVMADAARLEQVFWNVLKNAVKFTPRGGKVTVRSMNEEGGRLVIDVIDNGIGIDRDLMPRLFGAFEQAHSTGERFGGLGLGLAISRSIIERHGGSIAAASDGPGRGARITIALETVAATSVDAAAAAPAPLAMRALRILLVEDDPTTLSVMKRLLAERGHQIVPATCVSEALEVAREEAAFDLLLSDIGLPDGTGLDVMRALKDSGIKGIALSGYGMDADLQASADAGFLAHLTKPINLDQLEETIRRVAG